jgi:hypothetical protein
MKLENIRPMLAVTDLDATILFYRKLLGFECVSRLESWAALRKDNVELMISLPNAHEPFEKPMLTGSLYFNTADVDALGTSSKTKSAWFIPLRISFTACANLPFAITMAIFCNLARKSATPHRSRRQKWISSFQFRTFHRRGRRGAEKSLQPLGTCSLATKQRWKSGPWVL